MSRPSSPPFPPLDSTCVTWIFQVRLTHTSHRLATRHLSSATQVLPSRLPPSFPYPNTATPLPHTDQRAHSLTTCSLQLSRYSLLFSSIFTGYRFLFSSIEVYRSDWKMCWREARRQASGGRRHLPPFQLPDWGAAAAGAQIS